MKVCKITLWNGEQFYADKWSTESMSEFVKRAAEAYGRRQGDKVEFSLVEMTPEEYQAIPATSLSAKFFA